MTEQIIALEPTVEAEDDLDLDLRLLTGDERDNDPQLWYPSQLCTYTCGPTTGRRCCPGSPTYNAAKRCPIT